MRLTAIAPEALIPECPEAAPAPGLLAPVLAVAMDGVPQRTTGDWVRECLADNHGECPDGKTCAPLPSEDFELCISRELDGPCPADYYPKHVIAQEPGEPPAAPMTLCCTGKRTLH